MNRGLLIVLEGIDQCGKTTISKLLKNKLEELNLKTIIQTFPDKSTLIGNVINSYLQGNTKLSPQESHLLYSLNRHEKKSFMEEKLYNNYNIICDRYIFSGIAYSLANGLDYNFCLNTEQYLIKPDLIFYFDISITETNKRRKSLKTDIYETSNFQTKVKEAYSKIKNKDWIIINSEQTPEEITNIILKHILNIKNIKQFLEYY
ncbi:MAG: dTMP kinase [Tenericutes bacterium]|nr:dTMP kinase [Mycoplasmatota bacterium]